METKKKITRKVITSKLPIKAVNPDLIGVEAEVVVPEEVKREVREEIEESKNSEVRTKRVCLFCQNKSTPTYTDLVTLRRFLTDRAKILAKMKSGVCSKHQRGVSKNIKYARHLSLLPFVPKV